MHMSSRRIRLYTSVGNRNVSGVKALLQLLEQSPAEAASYVPDLLKELDLKDERYAREYRRLEDELEKTQPTNAQAQILKELKALHQDIADIKARMGL